MIIPSIDLQQGEAVQLVGGAAFELSAGDPRPLMETFRLAGEVAIVDLDAAMGNGDNIETIKDLVKMGRCRVGGGIRDLETAKKWLDLGADRIVLGTAARVELLSQLPKARVIAALDAVHGEVVIEGWKTRTGTTVLDRMRALRDHVGGFLVTFVEREGRMGGTAMDQIDALIEAAGDAELTIAGGVTTLDEIAELHHKGVHAQVGMALYKGHMNLAEAIVAPMKSDREDGLWPTVVTDARGVALGLCYSNAESVKVAVERKQGVYHSRRRGLWIKGETSGATQKLLGIALDCDADALRFTVEQTPPGFCHLERHSCFGHATGLSALEQTLQQRAKDASEGSYTHKLLHDSDLLHAKILEEAQELVDATTTDDVAWEAADLMYFTMVAMTRAGISLSDVEAILDQRSRKVTRRPGLAKPTTSKEEPSS